MNQLIKEYDYRVKLTTAIWPILLFGAAAWFFIHEAVTNDRGLIINGLIHLGITGATVFYWVMASFSMGFVLLGLIIMAAAILDRKKPVVRIYGDRFEYPAGLFTKKDPAMPTAEGSVRYVQVKYDDIQYIQILDIYRTRMIEVTLKDGKKHTMVDSRFRNKIDMDEVYKTIASKISASAG